MDLDLVAGAGSVGRFDGPPINPDVAFFNETLDSAARGGRELRAQKCIQPFGREGSIENQDFGAGAHWLPKKLLTQRRKDAKTRAEI